MRPSVFGIWIGLLVLVLGSALVRFALVMAASASALPGLVFNFAILTIFVVGIWLGALAYLQARHRRQVRAVQDRAPGSVAFPSYPTREFGAAVRHLAPRSTLEALDLITVRVDAEGVSVWRRGGDSTGRVLDLPRAAVVALRPRSLAGRFGAHPGIAVIAQQNDGLLEFVFPAFQPSRPFRRASGAQAEELVERATRALHSS
ncbi:MAG TPA: hypothetical protein VGM70_04690 [Pseudolysinimonas sp.]